MMIMRHAIKRPVSLLAATALGSTALSLWTALPARADYAPGPDDIVGLSSIDTQYVLDFGDDGDPEGDPGFNSGGSAYKVVSFDATADSNGREAYLNNSTYGNLRLMFPTDVLRAGSYPNPRQWNTDILYNSLINNQSTTGNSSLPFINFIAPTILPTAAQGVDFATGLEVVKIANDTLAMAKDTTSNDTVALSPEQLVKIYEANIETGCPTWSEFGVTGPGSDDWVAPLIPVVSTDTREIFLNDLAVLGNGGTQITLGDCVTTVEEDQPTGITSFVTPAGWGGAVGAGVADSQDAIMPFFGGRLNLWDGISGSTSTAPSSGVGYFRNPSNVYGTNPNPPLNADVTLVTTGTPSDGNSIYVDDVALTIVYPFGDNSSTTPGEPGSPYNWAQLLFCPPPKAGAPTPFFDTPAGQVDIAEAGATPSYTCFTTPLT
jgi:hypothetical protein